MRNVAVLAILAPLFLATACKPPPTDADMLREIPEAAPSFASEPLASPSTEGAKWALSERIEGRLIYGVPGEPALLSLDCDTADSPTIRITRISPADDGAGALLALVGNGHIGRLAVDATDVGGRSIWVGEAQAVDEVWEPLAGPRELIATVPGAGTVGINASIVPGLHIEACRIGEQLTNAALEEAAEPQTETLPLPR